MNVYTFHIPISDVLVCALNNHKINDGHSLGGGEIADDALPNDLHDVIVLGGLGADQQRLRRQHFGHDLQTCGLHDDARRRENKQ